MSNQNKVPNYLYEDLLFRRRLERQLRDASDRVNQLLKEQIELLQQRKELLLEQHCAVKRRAMDELGQHDETDSTKAFDE